VRGRREPAREHARRAGEHDRPAQDERHHEPDRTHPRRRTPTDERAEDSGSSDEQGGAIAHSGFLRTNGESIGGRTLILDGGCDSEVHDSESRAGGNQRDGTVVGSATNQEAALMPVRRVAFVSFLAALGLSVAAAAPAVACGGLVGENGTIQLQRTTTLAAYHDGVEHYVTSFEFSGEGQQVGSIVPLPGIPTSVERGGDWTLQRLEREVSPPRAEKFAAAGATATSADVEVIQRTTIDALEITILKGGGTEVGKWAIDHGFLLTPDAPEVLDFYSQRSPIFMAARFDATSAAARGQRAGDGTPIHLTIPVDRPWVPLRILALGRDTASVVNADVFLLTDQRPQLVRADPGVALAIDQPANTSLLDDLRADKGMSWVPSNAWFTYMRIDAPAGQLRHDLALSVDPARQPLASDAGLSPAQLAGLLHPESHALWYGIALLLVGVTAMATTSTMTSRRRAIPVR
jgi:hypothetical protein